MLVKQKIKKIKLILSILYLSYWQRATGNGQRAARIPNPAQDFLLCVARSASVYSVMQKIKTLFTTEVTEFTEVEIKPSMMFVLNLSGGYPAHFIKPCAR